VFGETVPVEEGNRRGWPAFGFAKASAAARSIQLSRIARRFSSLVCPIAGKFVDPAAAS
jgi:hypothetical protein